MTNPAQVRDKFLGVLQQTFDGGSAFVSGVFRLAFLFPAIVCAFFMVLFDGGYELAFKAPKVLQLPIQFPRKASR